MKQYKDYCNTKHYKAKFLGVIVDQHINWKGHISMVSLKVSKSCGIISRIRNIFDTKSKETDLL